jgi:hypothetical protein
MSAKCSMHRGIVLRQIGAVLLPLALLALTGCPPRGKQVVAPPPPLLPIDEAVAAVNSNVAGITKPLWGGAISVSAVVHDENGKVYKEPSLDATLRFLPPRDLYLDIKHLGAGTLMHVGSNEELFWVWVKLGRDSLWYGRWADLDSGEESTMPLAPDMVLAAMGLAPLPAPGQGLRGPIPQTDDGLYYKLLYLAQTDRKLWIQREYWLDRFPPYLPRVVVFRHADGRVRMQSRLDHYELVSGSDVYIARQVQMIWPDDGDAFTMKMGSASFRDLPVGAFRMDAKRIPIPSVHWTRVSSKLGRAQRVAPPSTATGTATAPASRRSTSEPATTEPAATTGPAASEPAPSEPAQPAAPTELESSPE